MKRPLIGDRYVPFLFCFPGVIINCAFFQSSNYPGLDDKVFVHAIYWID